MPEAISGCRKYGSAFCASAPRNTCFKRVLLGVIFQQIAQIDAIPEQAKMELADGGDAQAVAAGTEVFSGHDQADFAFIIR